jgi:hypothetical protein
MPEGTALALLLRAYRDEIHWLLNRAKELEGSQALVAADYVHRAKNLQAIIDGYERLEAKGS